MPAISGFQDELSDSVTEMTKLKTIIRRFDENLNEKVNKHMMLEFQDSVKRDYAVKEDLIQRD